MPRAPHGCGLLSSRCLIGGQSPGGQARPGKCFWLLGRGRNGLRCFPEFSGKDHMFERLGHFVSRNWGVLLAGWILALAALWWGAPKWDSVIYDGEFHYLPDRFPSRQAEALFTKAFSHNLLGSSVVIVAQRNSGDGLLDEDKTYIEETLVPRLRKSLGVPEEKDESADDKEVAASSESQSQDSASKDSASKDSATGAAARTDSAGQSNAGQSEKRVAGNSPDKSQAGKAPAEKSPPGKSNAEKADANKPNPVISRIRTLSDKEFGQLLVSEDQKATLVLLELTTDFTERKNEPTIAAIEDLIGMPGQAG